MRSKMSSNQFHRLKESLVSLFLKPAHSRTDSHIVPDVKSRRRRRRKRPQIVARMCLPCTSLALCCGRCGRSFQRSAAASHDLRFHWLAGPKVTQGESLGPVLDPVCMNRMVSRSSLGGIRGLEPGDTLCVSQLLDQEKMWV